MDRYKEWKRIYIALNNGTIKIDKKQFEDGLVYYEIQDKYGRIGEPESTAEWAEIYIYHACHQYLLRNEYDKHHKTFTNDEKPVA